VHEGGISTPFIVHWPAGIKARGELRHNPAHLVDVLPTVLDVLQVDGLQEWEGKPLPPRPGRSLRPAFTRDGSVTRDCLWWLHEGNRAIRVGDCKLVASKGTPWELYHLATDRAERDNVAAQFPDRVRELEALWEAETDRMTALSRTE
jgi:arylsulfatase